MFCLPSRRCRCRGAPTPAKPPPPPPPPPPTPQPTEDDRDVVDTFSEVADDDDAEEKDDEPRDLPITRRLAALLWRGRDSPRPAYSTTRSLGPFGW
mmetsp:Transcript_29532/g.95214  ORF Transcript_29532/g.95214 Transcript_29532/m.95214 type:complete len:96 (-) Transcript_29532:1414-1701(-)